MDVDPLGLTASRGLVGLRQIPLDLPEGGRLLAGLLAWDDEAPVELLASHWPVGHHQKQLAALGLLVVPEPDLS
jgi:hypothetical protein